jgi:uncharacterized protein YjbJ (UPF0337 family)
MVDPGERSIMGDKTDRAKGKAKEATAHVKRDPALAEEGRRDQMKGDLKSSAKKAKDAVKKL